MYATDYLLVFLRKKRMSKFTMQRRGLSLSTDIHHWINQFLKTAHSEDEQKCFWEHHLHVDCCFILLDSLVFFKKKMKRTDTCQLLYHCSFRMAYCISLRRGTSKFLELVSNPFDVINKICSKQRTLIV